MTDKIRTTISKFPFGFVFTPGDFPIDLDKQASVNRILNNMVAAGEIRRLSKGRFYKPQITQFGELPPDTYQIVKDLIEKNGKITGYITGYSVFNELGLTTQIPFSLQIGVRNEKKAIRRDVYRISFIKQQNAITKENIPLLRLLDCLRFFKNIPDAMPDETCKRLLYLFSQLDKTQIVKVKKLALKYNPSTIALLGALLQTLDENEDTNMLLNKLNPQTSYKLGISKKILHNQERWYIK
ncbi:MAG TPA: hypothetical protein GXX42_01240 [Petrimonas sp.]|uniref:DUF6088 family protein n=1 Tax=Petrimonas sp. TaxID=2023866 RepID=UPI000962547D|nr:MAG: hypothetical protein BGO33_07150 [Bacteroidia bacterium 43-41]HHV84428.1 hypothetical protein [Petrimonas sp.]